MRVPELVGATGGLGWVAVKAVLIFAVAVTGLRLGERRTLAQLGAFDFAVAAAGWLREPAPGPGNDARQVPIPARRGHPRPRS
jgi:hypothetical protein